MDKQYVLCIDRAPGYKCIEIGQLYETTGISEYDERFQDCYQLKTLDGRLVPGSYKWQFIEIPIRLINKPLFKLLL